MFMSWNHRVIKKELTSPTGEKETCFEIHEVYYDGDGNPDAYTENAVSPFGESLEELRQEMKMFMDCLDKPVLMHNGDKLVELNPTPQSEN